MPIVEITNPSDPLSQGDILKGITLFATDSDWSKGGLPAASIVKSDGCLVLSRPCALINKKKQFIVAAVEAYKEPPTRINTFEALEVFLEGYRDGNRSPDRFYLGHIPQLGLGRFGARFDSLHPIKLPSSADLPGFLAKHRVARLHEDFRRDVHPRMFSAFAQMGFDDYGWFSDGDLEWMLKTAEIDIATLHSECERLRSSGKTTDAADRTLSDFIARLEPYRTELEKRQANKPIMIPQSNPPAP